MGRAARSWRRRHQGQDRYRRPDQRAARLRISSHSGAAARFGCASRCIPIQRSERGEVICEASAVDERTVRNSGGGVERRYIIKTRHQLGESAWPIELALTNRDQMGFRMLLGRTALGRPNAHRAEPLVPCPRTVAAEAPPRAACATASSSVSRCHRHLTSPSGTDTPMKIALLARNPHLYSHRRICEAARARGHEIEVINTLRVSINITSRGRHALLSQAAARGFRRGDPAYRRLGDILRTCRAPPVRGDGRLSVERIRRHRPLARQAALPAAPGAPRHRTAGDRLHPRPEDRPRTLSISSAARRW